MHPSLPIDLLFVRVIASGIADTKNNLLPRDLTYFFEYFFESKDAAQLKCFKHVCYHREVKSVMMMADGFYFGDSSGVKRSVGQRIVINDMACMCAWRDVIGICIKFKVRGVAEHGSWGVYNSMYGGSCILR